MTYKITEEEIEDISERQYDQWIKSFCRGHVKSGCNRTVLMKQGLCATLSTVTLRVYVTFKDCVWRVFFKGKEVVLKRPML